MNLSTSNKFQIGQNNSKNNLCQIINLSVSSYPIMTLNHHDFKICHEMQVEMDNFLEAPQDF